MHYSGFYNLKKVRYSGFLPSKKVRYSNFYNLKKVRYSGFVLKNRFKFSILQEKKSPDFLKDEKQHKKTETSWIPPL